MKTVDVAGKLFAAWTDAEDAVVRESYSAGGIYSALKALPNRSKGALYHRARQLGVKRRRHWTAKDIRDLYLEWGTGTLPEVASKLGRTVIALYAQAQKLGLPLGVPQGWELLSHAADRTGYATKQLRQILHWYGVRIFPAYSRPEGGVANRSRIVIPIDVDEAVEAWLKTEPLATAARARGLCSEVLRRALLDIEIQGPTKRKGSRAHWRIPTVDIERAVARRERAERVTEAARRVRVSTATLAAWMRGAGLHEGRRFARYLPEEIDRIVAMHRGTKRSRAWLPRTRRPALAARKAAA